MESPANSFVSMAGGGLPEVSSLHVTSSSGSYEVVVSSGAAAAAIDRADVVLYDPAVQIGPIRAGVHSIPIVGAESSKTLSGCEAVLVEMQRVGIRRGDTVVAIGGGVVQDVATLVSSLYMRGLAWIYVPTTVMSMVDSCIGGKSSINVAGIKNLVGNIYPPVQVAIDPKFVTSLPSIAIAAGLCEGVKICFCRGSESFQRYLDLSEESVTPTDDATIRLFTHILDSKRWFIEVDEFDRGERQQLNFGHSFGHAFEAATQFALPHGIAVGIGMLAAVEHPLAHGPGMSQLAGYVRGLLNPHRDLIKTAVEGIDWEMFRAALAADKKNRHGQLVLILPTAPAGTRTVSLPLTPDSLSECERCLGEAIDWVLR